MKTILAFLLALAIALILPNPVWAGAGAAAGGSGSGGTASASGGNSGGSHGGPSGSNSGGSHGGPSGDSSSASHGGSGDDGGSGGSHGGPSGDSNSGSHGGSGDDGSTGGGGGTSNSGGGGKGGETGHDGGISLGLTHGRSDVASPAGFGVVNLGLQSAAELQANPAWISNPGTIPSKFDHTVSRELLPSVMLKLSRDKSLPSNWQTKVAPGIGVLGTNDTSAIVPKDRWDLGGDLTKMLLSINFGLGVNRGLGDNVEANAWWKLPWAIALIPLVPYFGALLVFVSGILKSGLTGQRIRKREQREPPVARPTGLDKFAAAFSIAGEQQQKALDEKTR
jgi:hypothetical protein